MSYEGRVQVLCGNGHLSEEDALTVRHDGHDPCWVCGNTEIMFENHVDDTNCDSVGVILDAGWETLLVSPEVHEVCNFGVAHVVKQATYRKPTDDEVQKLRHYWHSASETYKPMIVAAVHES